MKPRLILTVLAMLACLATIRPVSDPDTFYHLAHGRIILENGIPSVNTVSFTWPDHPWRPTDWLFDVFLHLVHEVAGFNGLIALSCLLVFSCLAVSLATAARLAGRWSLWFLPPAALVLEMSRFRLVPRPHLVTMLGLALLLALWFRPRSRRGMILLAALGAVWANFHAGVVFGAALVVCLLAASAGAALLAGTFREKRAALGADLLATAVFLGGTLLNVHGVYPYLYTAEHLVIGSVLPIKEFLPASFGFHETFFLGLPVLLALAIPLPPAVRLAAFAAGIPFFLVALKAVRLIPKFGVVVLPFAAAGLALAAADERRLRRWIGVAAAVVLGGLAVWSGARSLRLFPPGIGLGAEGYPEGAVDFIRRERLPGDFYNDFDDGGYLLYRLYPEKRIFQDGKVQRYPAGFFRELMSSMGAAAWQSLMDRYRVDGAIVKRRLTGSKMDYAAFFDPRSWALVYQDGSSYLFLRRGGMRDEIIRRHEFTLLRPHVTMEELRRAAAEEPRRFLEEAGRLEPGRLIDGNELSGLTWGALKLGRVDLATDFAGRGRRRYPGEPIFAFYLAEAARRAGRTDEARTLLREVIDGGDESLREAARRSLQRLSDAAPPAAGSP